MHRSGLKTYQISSLEACSSLRYISGQMYIKRSQFNQNTVSNAKEGLTLI